ncbi:glycosyl hydrolase-related protein [Telluribacter sp.]|uniref:glycosyl hydrolase-related protein n=1 Tax=Telluribacter sp. TaxID=1978767 RepID=UPI002E0E5883|nr:glycosyl hydrolase-related protein [Telluribacter sp.]
MKPSLIILCLFTWCNSLAQPATRIYLANDDHTDYMWTANEAQYDSAFVHMLDYYLDQIDSTRNLPPDFQARFNCDGSYWLRAYEKFRTPLQFNRLVEAIRSGHISSPLTTMVSTYGAQPTEAVLRGMYYAGQLERRLGLRFPLAVAMENQTLPLGLSSLWAGAGARYSWKGVCGCASRIPNAILAHRRHQLYRYNGLDGSGVIMKWYNLSGSNNMSLGGYAEARQEKVLENPLGKMASFVADLAAMCGNRTYPYQAIGAFGFGWDDLATYVAPTFIIAARNGTTPQRRVRVSNEVDFFEDIERTYPQLPTESVSYGNEWDTYPVSMNETTAKVRRATEKLRTAEALAAVVSIKMPDFARDLSSAKKQAWEAFGFYWEHDWTADGPVSQKDRAEWQIKIQNQITGYSDSLYTRSLLALGQQLKTEIAPRFFVFNPLSWTRSDVADVEYKGSDPVRVVDVTTGQEAISQRVMRGGRQYLRLWAEQVPSVGYKVFEIRSGTPVSQPDAARLVDKYFLNSHHKIRLRRSGVITDWIDLANNQSLIKGTQGRYLNDLGTAELDEGEPLVVENAGPVSVTLKAVSRDPILHTVRLTLYKNSPRIEIQDSIQENFGDLKTWAFSFDLKNTTTRHEELGAILTAKNETRGGHYASQNARYDWLTFNHFADVSNGRSGITLSNVDCSFFRLGKSQPDSLDEHSAQLNALAGGQTDPYRDTLMLGINNQFGQQDFLYQFALTAHKGAFDATSAMKFALEHQNPLVAALLTGEDTGTGVTSFSLLTLNDPKVLLWSVKTAEDGPGEGLITRFWNLNNKATRPTLTLTRPIRRAWRTSHIETNEQSLRPTTGKLKVSLQPHQLKTFRLLLD